MDKFLKRKSIVSQDSSFIQEICISDHFSKCNVLTWKLFSRIQDYEYIIRIPIEYIYIYIYIYIFLTMPLVLVLGAWLSSTPFTHQSLKEWLHRHETTTSNTSLSKTLLLLRWQQLMLMCCVWEREREMSRSMNKFEGELRLELKKWKKRIKKENETLFYSLFSIKIKKSLCKLTIFKQCSFKE